MKSFYGVAQGIVTSTPDELGFVELSFPWMDPNLTSSRAPISVPLGGEKRGQYFMPEVGDIALVAFEHGDFAHPYVLGFLWNQQHEPPESSYQNRVIKTPGGHTLRFEDKEGDKRIIIESDGGHKVVLDDKEKTVSVSGEGGGNEITIQTTGGIITLKASSQVSVQAPQIELTQGAAHPLVFGDQLMTYLTQLTTLLQSHLHVGQMALGVFPVTPAPPATVFAPPTPALISTQVRTG